METGITKIQYCPVSPAQKAAVLTVAYSLMGLTVVVSLYLVFLIVQAHAFRAALLPVLLSVAVITAIHMKVRHLIRDNQEALLTSGGIIFPYGSIIALRGRRWRRWEELKSARIEWAGAGDFAINDGLVMQFQDGTSERFRFYGMPEAEVEKLLVTVEMHARRDKLIGDYSSTRDYLAESLTRSGLKSFTSMWTDELTRRFSLATFNPLAPGTRLQQGRYTITSQLGFGGFAAVYNAVTTDGSMVVVKELAVDRVSDARANQALIEHMDREVALLAKLNHPNICRLIDAFVEGGHHYIVLEKLAGKNLRQLVADTQPLSESQVIELALQMADIIEYLHGQTPPVVHRDFTPENLILKDNSKLSLIDFNAATEYVSGLTGTIIGKQGYMPPEQIRGKAEATSDYYTMACTLFFLLAGKDPKPLRAIVAEQEKLHISRTLSDLLYSMTEQEAALRPDAADIISLLKQCGEQPSVERQSRTGRTMH